MNVSKWKYDQKHKNTRIFLADYLMLKTLSEATGASMAEALHKLIAGLKPEPKPELVAAHVIDMPAPAFRVAPTPALRVAPSPAPAIATNGSKVSAFRIKPGRVNYA